MDFVTKWVLNLKPTKAPCLVGVGRRVLSVRPDARRGHWEVAVIARTVQTVRVGWDAGTPQLLAQRGKSWACGHACVPEPEVLVTTERFLCPFPPDL